VNGITKVVLKNLVPGSGEIKFTVVGKNGTYLLPTGPTVRATLVIDSPMATTGQCGESTYTGSQCKFLPGGRVLCK
jgi:hypothetical protein